MKMIFLAAVILLLAFTYGQVKADDHALEDYYTEYASGVLIQKAFKIEKRPSGGHNCYPYGDQNVGYFSTQEQYENAYDPAIFAQE